MSEVKRFIVPQLQMWDSATQPPALPTERFVVMGSDFDRVTAERDAALGREAALKEVTCFKDAVACVFDNLKMAACNTDDREWDDRLEDLAEDVIEMAPEYKKQWKDICRLTAENHELQQRLTAADERADVLERVEARYRWLQKATPYRFKKIQDASVTDGGDVLYFHADRFDAAVDAALKPAECCTVSAEDRALLADGDYTPEELFGTGSKPSCPKCAKP